VFHFHGEQSLEYDYNPDDKFREQVERAVAACPVQAISIGHDDQDDNMDPILTHTGGKIDHNQG